MLANTDKISILIIDLDFNLNSLLDIFQSTRKQHVVTYKFGIPTEDNLYWLECVRIRSNANLLPIEYLSVKQHNNAGYTIRRLKHQNKIAPKYSNTHI